ncbi:hypothetical protein, partial [Bacillus sp. S1-R5C1-FB]|uniref:carbamoyl phosphate synthase preATP-grasp domain-containing protein n=1 Tax=Bacillus sp. S1-R5C1-FB TaxID=1973491 RepID=UPI0011550A99
MPESLDINTIIGIGSGPIVSGPAAEIDYSLTKACECLKEKGDTVNVVNANQVTSRTATTTPQHEQ